MQLRPVRNACFVGNDMWFISRGVNALFKYNRKSNMVEYFALPGHIYLDFMNLSTYHYDGKIYLVPVYNKGFGKYDITNHSFTSIITDNSKSKCNFNYSFRFDNNIFCVPNDIDGPFVCFGMCEEKEIREAIYLPKELKQENNFGAVQQISDTRYCGVLTPSNSIYILDLTTGKFETFVNGAIDQKINSIYIKDNYIYITVVRRLIVTDLEMNILAEHELATENEAFIIGDYKEYVFVDIVGKPIKYFVKFDNGAIVAKEFDESNTYIHSDENRFGIVQYNKEWGEYIYFSGGSNGIFRFNEIDDSFVFSRMIVDEISRKHLRERFIKELSEGNVCHENSLFGVIDFVSGVCKF